MKAEYIKYNLIFKQASGTSRGILKTKETYFLKIRKNDKVGYGECAVFRGLSSDDCPEYESKLAWLCTHISKPLHELLDHLTNFPSIQFGLEQAMLSIESEHAFELFNSSFTEEKEGISINGLIWMGDKEFMNNQIRTKLDAGFTTIKMKIGAIDFQTELALLKSIRKEYSVSDIVLRVDANGAFSSEEALLKLEALAKLDIHSIEQPIKQGQLEEMAGLCEKTPLPIALDEELIGISSVTNKQKLLQIINPQFIILKPSLVGGFKGSNEWIEAAQVNGTGWWITSALESNIGLNAIAQWTYTLDNPLPQGLGTGSLFTNNFDSPLEVNDGKLFYNNNRNWNLSI